MSPKSRSAYICGSCQAHYTKWTGKCASCLEWNTITELPTEDGVNISSGKTLSGTLVSSVVRSSGADRLVSGIVDLDSLLGGGFVPGSVSLLSGQPGIGKSTLLLQVASNLAASSKVLYVTAEESMAQVKLRADRINAGKSRLQLASTTNVNDIASTISSGDFDVVIVDSIQTVRLQEIQSAAGAVSQVTGAASALSAAAKSVDTCLILVGHVTKDGAIAGPKVLEHLVDTVMYFEGDRYAGFKILRCVKNRFGSTNQSAIFEMKESGLSVVENPSASLLDERQVSDGSIVLATMEGSRPLLVEIQALVNKTSFGNPKRAASGLDINRLNLLVAMLSKRTKLDLSDKDIHINLVGGLRIVEPAADLAICMCIASAAKGMQLKDDAVVFGEVGLSGEVRRVPFSDQRVAESKKLGFKYAIGPMSRPKSSYIRPVATIRQALNEYLSG